MLKKRTWVAAAVAAAAAAPAMADPVEMTWLGRGEGQTARITHDGRSMRVFAGELRYQFASPQGAARHTGGAHAVFRQSLTDAPARSLLAPRPGSVQAERAGSSLNAGQQAAIGAALAAVETGAASPAAAQLAIWEITHDFGDLDIRAGSFSAEVDEDTRMQIERLLAGARDSDAEPRFTTFSSPEAPTVLTTSSVMAPVPAPLALASAGLIVAIAARRRLAA